MEKNRYSVQIGNNSYILVTPLSKEETDQIVEYVNKMIDKASKSIHYRNPAMFATLACLNIADELYNQKKEFNNLKEAAEEPIREYSPLKEKYEAKLDEYKDFEDKLKGLDYKLKGLEKDLNLTSLDRDRYKLELDRQIKESEKSKLALEDLRNKLIEQEKQTLIARKQLQEALRRSE
ncbi:cell division protein ZapA [Peptoniphilaceae bacterium SGI.131]